MLSMLPYSKRAFLEIKAFIASYQNENFFWLDIQIFQNGDFNIKKKKERVQKKF